MSGKAIIISAPSGSGKTTIVRHLLRVNPALQFSISATTRNPRFNEVDGMDYYFLSVNDFKTMEFVEKEEVYKGVFYGTLKSEVDRIWANRDIVIFDVDVNGAMNLKQYFGDNALSIFIKVGDIEIIRERLTRRNTESPEDLERRIDKASYEMGFEHRFDYVVSNIDLSFAQKNAESEVNEFIG